jgi:hypothetical protein
MPKISKLPKASSSSNSDLLVIVQGEETKRISKEELLGALQLLSQQNASNIKGLQTQLSKRSINKKSPVFTSPVKASDPIDPKHLTTKEYVDKELHNVLRDDGAKKLINPLEFMKSPSSFKNNELITKKYADDLLLGVLKTIVPYSENSLPAALAGECFMMQTRFDVFSVDGPEVQKGDILICLEDSVGGTYSSVGHQFAIINTNVVSATEVERGIIAIASTEDMEEFSTDEKAITPLKYKNYLEDSSIYNRTVIDRATYNAVEADRGILAVDNRRSASTITLPNVSGLKHPKLFKIVIKDEFGQADVRNITIKAAGSSIDSKTQIVLANKYQAVTLYNDGKNYYVENNTHAADETSERVMQAGLVHPASAATTETMYQANIDLSQFDIAQGFRVEVSGFFAANANTKTVILDIDGNTTVTNATTTAPNSKYFTASVTVLKEARYAIAYGAMLLDGIAADTYGTNSLNMDWDTSIVAKVTANAATTNTDVHVYSMIVEPLK